MTPPSSRRRVRITMAPIRAPQCGALLLRSRGDHAAADGHGVVPLHAASSVGSVACVRMLLSANADVHAQLRISGKHQLSLPKRRMASTMPQLYILLAWFAENPVTRGAVFSRRTAENQPYPPPADPPRQALTSCPARCSVFFFSPWLSSSKFGSRNPQNGTNACEDRRRTGIFVTAMV